MPRKRYKPEEIIAKAPLPFCGELRIRHASLTDAALQNRPEHPPQQIALAEVTVPVLGES